jgi:hypothetical protein
MNRRKNTSAHTINGQFAPRTIEMLRSPAMRALSLTGRRILDRVEIELASHGGKDNGHLPVTHTDLIEFGIHEAGTVKADGNSICAHVSGLPVVPYFRVQRTTSQSFRGSIAGFESAYCDFYQRKSPAQLIGRFLR